VAELHLLPYEEYVAQLPYKRMSAGMLLRDDSDRVLTDRAARRRGHAFAALAAHYGVT
jgi:hypothetical protein